MRYTALLPAALMLAAPLAAQSRDTITLRRSTDARAARGLELRLQETERVLDEQRAMLRLGQLEPAIAERLRESRIMLDERSRELSQMQRRELGEVRARLAEIARRPRLGITVALDARDTDRYGAYINGVTPGGPADKAGLRAGDIIRRIGKVDLTERDGIRRASTESVPGLKLIETVGKLEAGKPVEIAYRRGTRDQTTRVTPEESDDHIALEGLPAQGMIWRRGPDGDVVARIPFEATIPRAESLSVRRAAPVQPSVRGGMLMPSPSTYTFAFTRGGPLGRLELTSLNPGLGSYFGASEGVLVISVPEGENPGNLQAGDVITAVDGRKVTSPSQLLRIVSTYEKNEELKLQVMRQRRSESVTLKLP